ncbi:hypothetical protein KCP70_02825 [Salmonella enterica subsp. enterica]|nr:hypothetical protein KCP70_02825 [Salmonella enterica subsp. enterica]
MAIRVIVAIGLLGISSVINISATIIPVQKMAAAPACAGESASRQLVPRYSAKSQILPSKAG